MKCWTEGNIEPLPLPSFGYSFTSLTPEERLEMDGIRMLMDDKPKERESRLGRGIDENGEVIEGEEDDLF